MNNIHLEDKKYNKVINEFWVWFNNNSEDYYLNLEKEQSRLVGDFCDHLYKINSTLGCSFSLIDKKTKKRTITISANNRPANIPLVQKIITSAPKVNLTKRWRIIGFNPKQKLPNSLEFENGELSTDDIYFEYFPVPDGIEINVFVKDYDKSRTFRGAIALLIEDAVGEYDVLKYIKMIRVGKLEKRKLSDLKPLKQLPNLINKIK